MDFWCIHPFSDEFSVAPSNYLKLVSTAPAGPTQESNIMVPETVTVANVGPQELYPYKAEALYACEWIWTAPGYLCKR